jgi:hypothetical protein
MLDPTNKPAEPLTRVSAPPGCDAPHGAGATLHAGSSAGTPRRRPCFNTNQRAESLEDGEAASRVSAQLDELEARLETIRALFEAGALRRLRQRAERLDARTAFVRLVRS